MTEQSSTPDKTGAADCSPSITSPPRTPLGVLNSSGNNGPGVRSQDRTPQEDRLIRKVSKRNHRGETPLHCSAIKGNVAMVRKLLRMGADPNTQDNAGWSPLHEACNHGNEVAARLLLKRGALVNMQGMHKETPLHDAARNGHFQVVRLLLKSGADRGVLNGHNQTALEAASCPRNPCKEESRLRRVVALLDGTDGLSDVDEEQDEDRVGGLGASKGLFLPGKDSGTLSGR